MLKAPLAALGTLTAGLLAIPLVIGGDRHATATTFVCGEIPVRRYWPKALDHPAELDTVPMPSAGNTLTVRQYQTRWMTLYQTTSAAGDDTNGCGATVDPSGYALPLPKAIIDADPAMLGQPHHDYPATDLIVPTGTPFFAMRGGTIARIVTSLTNCWETGRCDEPCGTGLSINGDDGARWIYCHASRLDNLAVGDVVTTGQHLGATGNTGRSGTPHLHLEIKVDSRRRCPQKLLVALHAGSQVPPPGTLPPTGCSF